MYTYIYAPIFTFISAHVSINCLWATNINTQLHRTSNSIFSLLLDCRSGSLLNTQGLPTETTVESGMSQSKSGTSVNLSNSGAFV